MPSFGRTWRLAVAMALFFCLVPRDASAHLANFGSWELTREYLGELFPEATEFKAKKDTYTDAEVKKLEDQLGFKLYPEDRSPTFYIANRDGEFLGVALFIDPRVEPKMMGGAVLTLEVGIGVDPKGAVHRVKVYDYRGNLELTRPDFLDQLRGRTLDSDFRMGEDGLEPVAGEEEESQLVANATHEALLLMKTSLSAGRSEPAKPQPKSGCSSTGGSPGSIWLLMLLLGWIRCRNR